MSERNLFRLGPPSSPREIDEKQALEHALITEHLKAGLFTSASIIFALPHALETVTKLVGNSESIGKVAFAMLAAISVTRAVNAGSRIHHLNGEVLRKNLKRTE